MAARKVPDEGRRTGKVRLDLLLVERGLAPSREQARRWILAGEVRVEGQVADKPGHLVPREAQVEVVATPKYVSRGGLKLEAALRRFAVPVRGAVAADFGASTGGFTDCLLQAGAARVYALDVGYGQLAWALRQDPRVVVMERTNVRYLEALPEPVDLVTVDVSFISLRLVLPAASRVLKPVGHVIALVKPQFEAGPRQVGKGGVVRDRRVHRQVLREVLKAAQEAGFVPLGLIPSPLRGPAGNVEFLAHLAKGWEGPTPDAEALVEECLGEVQEPALEEDGDAGTA
jgi:23S rRNA (cytidine1920-2'-O)/16S rRNA (cytidine1409-2'-O)-methyltransferase